MITYASGAEMIKIGSRVRFLGGDYADSIKDWTGTVIGYHYVQPDADRYGYRHPRTNSPWYWDIQVDPEWTRGASGMRVVPINRLYTMEELFSADERYEALRAIDP